MKNKLINNCMKLRYLLATVFLSIISVFIIGMPNKVCAAGPGVQIDNSSFPDDNFREYIKEYIDTSGDGYLSSSEINAVTYIYASEWEINDLSGIEIFTELESLTCNDSFLTEIDLSMCENLTDITLDNNKISKMELPKGIQYLSFSYNKVKEIDLNKYQQLVSIDCSNNIIEKINCSGLYNLNSLDCYNNKIKELNLKNCPNLMYLLCYNNQLTTLDVSGYLDLYKLDCAGNNLSSLNISQNCNLTILNCWNNYFSQVDISSQDVDSIRCERDYGIPSEFMEFGVTIDKTNKLMKFAKVKKKPEDEKPKTITPVVSLNKTKFIYTGKVQKPSVTVKDGNTVLSLNVDYTLTYSGDSKKVGTYKVNVTLKGKYRGTASATYVINPDRTSFLSKIKKVGNVYIIKWKKQSKEVSGYEFQYSTNKNFKKGKVTKTVKIKKSSIAKTKIKNLKHKKKYYMRIRTYKTVKGKKYYSNWSGVKSFVTPK